MLRFLNSLGLLKCRIFNAFESAIIRESDLVPVPSPNGGIFKKKYNAGEEVSRGQELAEILDPLRGGVKAKIVSPCNGRIFFSHKAPIVTEHQTSFFISER